jgi:hypothetical protein
MWRCSWRRPTAAARPPPPSTTTPTRASVCIPDRGAARVRRCERASRRGGAPRPREGKGEERNSKLRGVGALWLGFHLLTFLSLCSCLLLPCSLLSRFFFFGLLRNF